ncbi:hypothetical protein XENOCAPTIV_027807 [Xenoophorus captivus]|uniref:Uncharacterized protein n=1 Tax=Xenoophorus captivus TaxID=1517983 RepID=A0ABV0RE45_9TELE
MESKEGSENHERLHHTSQRGEADKPHSQEAKICRDQEPNRQTGTWNERVGAVGLQPHHFISHPSICLHIYQTVFLTPIHLAILRDTSKLDPVDLTKGSFLAHRCYRIRYSSIRRWKSSNQIM